MRVAGFAEKDCLKTQAAAYGFLDNPHAFYREIAFRRGLTLAESLAQVFYQRILAAGNAAQPAFNFLGNIHVMG